MGVSSRRGASLGMAINRFCGCCNPVYFALTSDGGFITSERGLARVNIYSASGSFKGAVAGPETLVDDKQLAKRACADCRQGGGFDVARLLAWFAFGFDQPPRQHNPWGAAAAGPRRHHDAPERDKRQRRKRESTRLIRSGELVPDLLVTNVRDFK